MSRNIMPIALLMLWAALGCYMTNETGNLHPDKTETVLSEVINLPSWRFFIGGVDICAEKYSRYVQFFGVKEKDYSYIYEGLNILRTTLLSRDGEYVFEIQTEGDIDLARKFYGKAMQFEIWISYTPYHIFTTAATDEALLVIGESGPIVILQNEKNKTVSARRESKYKVLARLKINIDRDRMRIYLPKRLIEKQIIKNYGKVEANIAWAVFSKLALPPLKPIPTNLEDVFFLPKVCSMWYPPSRSILTTEEWITERISSNDPKNKKPAEKPKSPRTKLGKKRKPTTEKETRSEK